jgi:hypothetical protein
MWDITAETKALALAPVRHIWCRAIFGTRSGNTWTNDRNYYGTDKIVSAVVDIGTKSGGIQVGNAFCGKLTLLLLDGVEIRQSDRIIMRVGFYKADGSRSEEISLGWYYVDTIKKANGFYTVTAYDKMLRAHKNYNSKLTYPAKMSAVLLELCDLLDVNLASDFAIPYDGTISEKPAKGTDSDGNTIYYTRREMLSYLASAMGGNFFFDAGGHLQLTRFATVEDSFAAANSIEADISDDSYSVNGIVWTLGGVTYSRNDEDTNGIMEFENPLTFYPKEPVQHAIEERVTGLNYHEAAIRRQGCGWFELGDIVTAYRANGTNAPVLITGLNYSIADGGFAEKIYSSARSSSQDNYTTGDIVGQSVPQSVGGAVQSSSGTGGILTEYQYLTDTSVKFNGTTYTVEKDAETGLISKISDSAGNEFEPEISAGITDVAAHNAVFWAVAMCRGISKMAFIMDGIFGMFTPDTRDIANSRWRNSVSGYNDITLSGGSENGSALHFNPGEYGSLICDEPNTVYCVTDVEFKQVSSETWIPLITKKIAPDRPNYGYDLFSLCLADKRNLLSFSAIICDIISEADSSEIHTVCYTRDNGKAYLYIDSVLVGTQLSVYRGNYSGNMLLNYSSRGGVIPSEHELGGSNFYMCAFGSQYHDEATVRNNSAYLMKKYKIGGNT